MNKVTINGKTYSSNGNISIINGNVVIDGAKVDTAENVLQIEVIGTLNNLTTDLNVCCDNVAGDVKAGGSVNCDNVGGSVSAGGSVTADDVKGNVSAGGSVVYG